MNDITFYASKIAHASEAAPVTAGELGELLQDMLCLAKHALIEKKNKYQIFEFLEPDGQTFYEIVQGNRPTIMSECLVQLAEGGHIGLYYVDKENRFLYTCDEGGAPLSQDLGRIFYTPGGEYEYIVDERRSKVIRVK